MPFDTISTVVNEPEISLVLNGELVKNVFDPLEVYCGWKIGGRYNAEILTCSCGVAGCAGIFEGTKVKHRKISVEWRDIDCGLPKKFYAFRADEYAKAMREIYEQIKVIIANKERHENEDNEDSYYAVMDLSSMKAVDRNIIRRIEWMDNFNRKR